MFCPICGNKNPDDAKFCSECGELMPVIDENLNNQYDDAVRPKERTPEKVGEVTERVFSKTDHESPLHKGGIQEKSSESLDSTGNIAAPGNGPAVNTVKMGSNPEPWKVGPAGHSTQNKNPAPGRNPYYIPPATVISDTGLEEEDAVENNTALIIIIIVLITLIILVGIFAFAYMRGYIDI